MFLLSGGKGNSVGECEREVEKGAKTKVGVGVENLDDADSGHGQKLTSNSDEKNIPGAWRPNVKHNKDERAAKNDNADVPIHFWNKSLANKLKCDILSDIQQKAMEMLRTIFVRKFWTRNVTTCFCSYIRCKACHLKRLESKFDINNQRSTFSCARCKQHLPSPFKFRTVEFKQGKYQWRSDGKQKYNRWYNIFRKKANVKEACEIALDIEAGIDCIARAVACTP